MASSGIQHPSQPRQSRSALLGLRRCLRTGEAGWWMTNNEYQFLTAWQMHATAQEIVDVLSDAADLPRWWPSVYLRADVVEPGDDIGVGRVIDLWTKGWLPYTLRWRFTVVDSDPPRSFRLDADGDFVGR